MRILITGSRTWTDAHTILKNILNCCVQREQITIVHGACPTGADAIVDELARNHGWTVEKYPANWFRHGKRAGFVRNSVMVKTKPDICLAFIKDNSKGATMCADLAARAGIPTFRFAE